MKALKRRVGAHAVTIDTLEEMASYSLLDPRKINFKELDTACDSAHYKLVEVKLEAWGEVVQVAGKEGKFISVIQAVAVLLDSAFAGILLSGTVFSRPSIAELFK